VIVSRVRVASVGVARPLEISCLVVLAVAVWRLALGWDWAAVSVGTVRRPPQSTVDWVILAVTALLAVGWLGLRGRAVLGTVVICVPVVVLSGWRMSASTVVDWPVGLASLVFVLSAICMTAAAFGAALRRLQARRVRRAAAGPGRSLVNSPAESTRL
jgi:hypothetical protein